MPADASIAAAQYNSGRDLHRLDGIDILRGISILAVILLHINLRIPLSATQLGNILPRQIINVLGRNGANGVTIFFAISGFLITTMSLRRWGALSQIDVRVFYRLRFARIAPLLLLLLGVLSMLHFMHLPDYTIRSQQGGLGQAVFAALTFHINWLEAQRGYLPASWDVLWSLSIEEMFYLFFPPACRALRPRWLLALLLIFVALGPFARTVFTHNELWVEKSYLGSMDAIALGCLSAMALPRRRLRRTWLVAAKTAGIAMIALILGFTHAANRLGLYRTGLDTTVLAIGVCLVMLVAAQTRRRASSAWLPLLWLGRHSYEIYLTHMFVVLGMVQWFSALGGPMRWSLAWYGAMLLLAGLLGAITAQGFSEPLNRRLRQEIVNLPPVHVSAM